MKKSFVLRSLCCAFVLLAGADALASALPSITGAVLGADNNFVSWRLQAVASVTLKPGSVSLPVQGQVICPNLDFSGGKCTSNVYWMVYQIPGGAAPNLKLSITGLTGFVFDPTNAGAGTKFGVLQCDSNFTTATALCTTLTTPQLSAMSLGADPLSGGLSVTMPVGVFPGSALCIFVAVTDPSFTTHGIAPALLTVDPTPAFSNKYVLPDVISGGGYATKISIVNTSTVAANGVVNYISPLGAFVSSTAFSLNPGGVFRVQTPEADRFKPAVISWAWVGSDQPVGINLFFEFNAGGGTYNIVNSLGFNPPPLLTDFTFPAEFEPHAQGAVAGKTAAVAFANPNSTPASLTLTLLGYYGDVDATYAVNLPAYGQATIDLGGIPAFAAWIPLASNLIGSFTVHATASIGAIALQATYGPFSATPIMAGKAK